MMPGATFSHTARVRVATDELWAPRPETIERRVVESPIDWTNRPSSSKTASDHGRRTRERRATISIVKISRLSVM